MPRQVMTGPLLVTLFLPTGGFRFGSSAVVCLAQAAIGPSLRAQIPSLSGCENLMFLVLQCGCGFVQSTVVLPGRIVNFLLQLEDGLFVQLQKLGVPHDSLYSPAVLHKERRPGCAMLTREGSGG
mmetsp:Transcript_28554/g.39444  ORF Transcript_28554/g.39444 Transcript_28554/m.39444 type:complete len:125 (-) Transcript_28554:765-1139(-)